MSDDSKNLSRVEDLLNNDPYLPKTPMSRVEKLLEDGILPKVTPADNGKILKVKDGEWETGEDISGDKLPPVSSADNGKVLKVVDAEWNIGEDEGDRLPFVTSADEGKVLKVDDQGHWEPEEEDPELPATTSADEGKILKVDSNGDWSKGDETVELPSVSSSDNGKILKVNNGAWSAGNETVELPAVTSSDNGKVLKVDNGTWTKADETVELPSVSSSDNGKILKVTEGNWAKGDLPSVNEVPAPVAEDSGKVLKATGANAYGWGPDEGLPAVTSSDNGKILKVTEGQWAKGDAPTELPSVSSSDNGKILKVTEGNWAKGDAPSELPAVSGSDNGKILKVTEGEWAKGDAPSGLPEVTVADEGKILEVNSSGEWDKGDAPESIQVGNATGDIVSFNDGADNILIPKLMIDIQPKQDLHGYDSPWVGGGGKNKLPLTVDGIKSANGGSSSWSGNAITINGVTFTILTDSDNNVTGIKVNGTASINTGLKLVDTITNITPYDNCIINGCPSGGSTSKYRIGVASYDSSSAFVKDYNDLGSGVTLTFSQDNVSKFYVSITIYQGYNAQNLVFKPMIRLSSVTDSTFAPYSNECPISGWTACNVVRSGANLWDEEWELGIYNTSTGEKQADNSKIRSKNYISVKPSNSYRIVIPSSAYCRYFCYDINKNLIITEANQGSVEITTPNNCYFMTFNMGQEYGTTYNNDISINYPSTDTEYHAYNGNTYTINFVDGSSPLTVYGGTLDVLSGVLMVTRGFVVIDNTITSNNVSIQSSTDGLTVVRVVTGMPAVNGNNQICNIATYNANAWRQSGSENVFVMGGEGNIYLRVFSSLITTQSDALTFFANKPMQIVYELATPQTYQLTPTEVKSLLEKNVIYADAGKVTVTYYKHSEALEDMDILFSKLPNVNTTDNNKALLVKDGEWTKAELPEAQDLFVAKTQQQYDDLPSSKYTDNILYFITDGEIEGLIPTILTEVQYGLLTPEQKADRTKLYFIGDKYIYYRGVRYDGPEASVNAIKQGLNDNGISLQYYKDSEIVGSGSFVTPYPIGVFAGGEPQISSVYGGDPDFQWVGYGTQLQYILNYNHGLEKPLPPGYDLIDYVKPSEVWWLNYAETALSSMGSETQPTNPGSYHDIHHWAGFYFRVTHDFNKEGPLLFKLGDRVEAYADVINGDFYLSVRINYGDSWGTGLVKLVEDYIPAIGKECRILLKVISGSFYCEFDCEKDNISSGSKSITTYGDISSSAIGISSHLTVTALYIYRSTEGSTSAIKHFIAKHIDDNDHTVYSLLADNDSSWDMEPYSLYDYSSFDYAHFTLGGVVEQANIETYINAKRFRTRNPQKLYGEDELWMKVPNLPSALPADNGKSIKVLGGKWVKDYILHDEDDVIVGKDSWNEDIVQRVIEVSDYDYPNGISSTDGLIHLFTVNTIHKELINCEIVRAAGLHTDINNVLTMSDPSKDPRVGLVVVAKWIDSSHLGFYALVTQTDVTVHPTITDPADRNIHYGEIVVQYSLRIPFFV